MFRSGYLALLLAGLRDHGLDKTSISPYMIRRVIENTALNINNIEPFALGHGLIQVRIVICRSLSYCQHAVTSQEKLHPMWFDHDVVITK